MPAQNIICCDCAIVFDFTEGEQEFYASKELTPPKRCKPCREAKKARREGGQQRRQQSYEHNLTGVHEENVAANGAADYL